MKTRTAVAIVASLAIIASLLTASGYAQFKTGGAPLKRAWGPVRGVYTDTHTGGVRLVLEDSSGTVRIIRPYIADGSRTDCAAGESCTDVVVELRRD
jgi:hypothetical protein